MLLAVASLIQPPLVLLLCSLSTLGFPLLDRLYFLFLDVRNPKHALSAICSCNHPSATCVALSHLRIWIRVRVRILEQTLLDPFGW